MKKNKYYSSVLFHSDLVLYLKFFLSSMVVIFFFIAADLSFFNISTDYYLNNLIVLYIYSFLLFVPLSYLKLDQKKMLFFLFLFYNILRFSFNPHEKLVKIEVMEDSLLTILILIAAKCAWIFFILSLLSDNIKKYLCNSIIFIMVSLVVYNFAIHAFIIFIFFYITVKLIMVFINVNIFVKYTINKILYFSIAYFILEVLSNLNIIFISSNILNLLGFETNDELLDLFTKNNVSFIFLNYFFKETLIEFNEKLYISESYMTLIKNDFLYVLNIIRDKLSYLFFLIICFYKHRFNYIKKTINIFLIFSIATFILNYFYFLDKLVSDQYIFIKLIYSIFFYYITYISIEVKMLNKDFFKSNAIYFFIIFVLYIINDKLYDEYKINFFNYIIFYVLFKIKDNIKIKSNQKAFTINILLSCLMLGLSLALINSNLNNYSGVYNITVISILSINILYFSDIIKNIFVNFTFYIFNLSFDKYARHKIKKYFKV